LFLRSDCLLAGRRPLFLRLTLFRRLSRRLLYPKALKCQILLPLQGLILQSFSPFRLLLGPY
jgi:hypothetical protein